MADGNRIITIPIPQPSPRDITRFWSKVIKHPDGGCWLWTGTLKGGYGSFKIKNVAYKAHRLSYFLSAGVQPSDFLVCHNCPDSDNKLCVNPDHLYLGTIQDNIADAVKKKQMAGGSRHRSHTHPETVIRGESHRLTKLTADQVREIRRLRASGKRATEIAILFGINNRSVSNICLRINWKHID
jgi:hypothetical protein